MWSIEGASHSADGVVTFSGTKSDAIPMKPDTFTRQAEDKHNTKENFVSRRPT
jgi:hypothetical protein